MSLKFLNREYINIDDEKVRKENGLNKESVYSYLLINSKLLFSDDHIIFTNQMGVYILNIEEWMMLIKFDSKYVNYLGIDYETVDEVLFDLRHKQKITPEMIFSIYGFVNNLNIVTDIQENSYLFNHYLKKSNRLLLRWIVEDSQSKAELDPNGLLQMLIATGLDLELAIINRPNDKPLKWAYMNVREDTCGFIYPVINIVDYKRLMSTGELYYLRYYIPVNVLRTILQKEYPITLSASQEDLMRSNQICIHCKFNLASQVHVDLCKIFKVGDRDEIL